MRAWLLDGIGSLEHLRLGEAPDPSPGRGEALLEVLYAGLNPADRYLAEGQYPARPAMPHILGRDGLGKVVALGEGIDPAACPVGAIRMLLRGETGVERPGTFAQRVAVPVESLVAIPQGWTLEQAGGSALVYLTAYQALTNWGRIRPGVVLVTGASGGVGLASVHLAKAMMHRVVALSRDAAKRHRLLEEGADHVLDPSDPAWRKTLLGDVLKDARVDLAIDNIGGDLLPQVIATLGEGGRVSCVGRLAGPVPSFNTASLFFRRIKLGGVAVSAYAPAEARSAWESIVSLLAERGRKPVVDSTWEFAQLPQAFERLSKGPMGKVLLNVGGA